MPVFSAFDFFPLKVKWWITLNEPLSVILGYTGYNFAPQLNLDSPAAFIIVHNLLKAHGRVFRLYEEKYKPRQQGKPLAIKRNYCISTTLKEVLVVIFFYFVKEKGAN